MKDTDQFIVTCLHDGENQLEVLWAEDLEEVVSHVKDLVESGVPKARIHVKSVQDVPLTVTTITRVTGVMFGREDKDLPEDDTAPLDEVDEMLDDLAEPSSPVSASSGAAWHRDSFVGLTRPADEPTDKPLNQE